jgi:hypothetical protein
VTDNLPEDPEFDALQQYNDANRHAETMGFQDLWDLWRRCEVALKRDDLSPRDRRLVEAERDRVAAIIGVLPTRSAA